MHSVRPNTVVIRYHMTAVFSELCRLYPSEALKWLPNYCTIDCSTTGKRNASAVLVQDL